jgi:predicted phosphodiesterase
VLGNNDHGLAGALPERLEVVLGGVRLAVVHDAGPRAGRERRAHRWFPDAQVVVFGHSHEPLDAAGVHGQRLLNPGSAVQRRRQPHRTMGLLALGGGAVRERRLLIVEGEHAVAWEGPDGGTGPAMTTEAEAEAGTVDGGAPDL